MANTSFSGPLATVVAVPARLQSSRLPNKVLADIGGRSMLQRVLERCRQARTPRALVLCTDSEQLADLAGDWGFTALLTSVDCQSGSERIASVTDRLVALAGSDERRTLIINVQGDQPFIDPAVIDAMAKEFERRMPTPDVLTPVYPMSSDRIHNPNVVKTLLAADGRALYFSRSALPHVREAEPDQWHQHTTFWGHVGIYGYRADVLQGWNSLPHSPLEHTEKLEQLRLIEAGVSIGTFAVEGESLSVDTAEQLEEARAIASQLEAGGG
jgi:3-deoxy-manno-octulosonate cytidylyltransferase (CMP-KDO synthetase)